MVKLSLDFWRSCGCSLVGLDEEDLVRGCIENFNECSLVREWINIKQWESIGVLDDISNEAHPLQSIPSVQKRLTGAQLLDAGKATTLTVHSLK